MLWTPACITLDLLTYLPTHLPTRWAWQSEDIITGMCIFLGPRYILRHSRPAANSNQDGRRTHLLVLACSLGTIPV